MAARLERFRDGLRRLGLGAAWLTRPEDVRYLSGFAGDSAWLLVGLARVWLVTDFRFVEEAGRSARGAAVVRWESSPGRTAGGLLRRHRVRRAGVVTGHITARAFMDLKKASTGVAWTPVDPVLDRLRSVKSPWEASRVARAQSVAEQAFRDWLPGVAAGVTERDLAADLERGLRRAGAEGVSFPTIVAAGSNASRPHAIPGNRKVTAGRPLVVDFGAKVDGYCSDTTRTLFLGDPGKQWRERYKLVLEAQDAALLAVGPGEGGPAAARAAARVFVDAKVADLFGHGLGHGVGLAIHEPPRLAGWKAALGAGPPTDRPRAGRRPAASPSAPANLEPGNIVTVEPGLYWPGEGGIRIEDMVYVTRTGCRNCTRLPKKLEDVIL